MFLCVRVVQAEHRLVWLNAACQASAADRAYLNRRSTVCSCSLVRSSLTVPLFPLALPPFPYSAQTPVNICVSSQSNSFLLTFLGEFKPLSSDIYSTLLCKSLESPLSCHFFFLKVVLRSSSPGLVELLQHFLLDIFSFSTHFQSSPDYFPRNRLTTERRPTRGMKRCHVHA